MRYLVSFLTTLRHYVGMISDRPDTHFATIVDQALGLAEQKGVRAAAAYLTQYGADFALICRVLQEPTRRRVREAMAVLAVLRE